MGGTELSIGAMDPEPQAVAQGVGECDNFNNCLANFVPVDLINEIDRGIDDFFHFLWVVVEGLPSGELIVAHRVRHGGGQGGQFTYCHKLRRLALLSLTRWALAALPSVVSLSQQQEHSAPWMPLLWAPHAWQVSGCQGVPAFWRAYQRRWRAAAVGSGINGAPEQTVNLGFHQRRPVFH